MPFARGKRRHLRGLRDDARAQKPDPGVDVLGQHLRHRPVPPEIRTGDNSALAQLTVQNHRLALGAGRKHGPSLARAADEVPPRVRVVIGVRECHERMRRLADGTRLRITVLRPAFAGLPRHPAEGLVNLPEQLPRRAVKCVRAEEHAPALYEVAQFPDVVVGSIQAAAGRHGLDFRERRRSAKRRQNTNKLNHTPATSARPGPRRPSSHG